jgi:hypothetical protein
MPQSPYHSPLIHFVVAFGNAKLLAAALETGCYTEAVDSLGRASLHIAVLHRKQASLLALLGMWMCVDVREYVCESVVVF